MTRNYYSSGSWNCVCDSCGKKIKASEARKRWDGLIVCADDCWEPRHPHDFVKAKLDKITVPYTRPVGTDIFALQEGIFDSFDLTDSITTEAVYRRDFDDTFTFSDTYTFLIEPAFSDSVSLTDTTTFTVDKTLVDSFTFSDSGSIVNFDYVDSTYFQDDYVGTIYTF